MKHPNRDEWVPYLFGECDPSIAESLAGHLRECDQCREELKAWRRTLRRLDQWELPKKQPVFVPRPALLKWAAAAMVVFGLGLWFGHMATTSTAAAKASVVSEVKGEVEQLRRELANSNSRAEALGAATDAEARKMVAAVVRLMAEARAEDRNAFLNVVEQLQREREQDYVSLRKDLETVASVTDEEFQDARWTLVQLADQRLSTNH